MMLFFILKDNSDDILIYASLYDKIYMSNANYKISGAEIRIQNITQQIVENTDFMVVIERDIPIPLNKKLYKNGNITDPVKRVEIMKLLNFIDVNPESLNKYKISRWTYNHVTNDFNLDVVRYEIDLVNYKRNKVIQNIISVSNTQ